MPTAPLSCPPRVLLSPLRGSTLGPRSPALTKALRRVSIARRVGTSSLHSAWPHVCPPRATPSGACRPTSLSPSLSLSLWPSLSPPPRAPFPFLPPPAGERRIAASARARGGAHVQGRSALGRSAWQGDPRTAPVHRSRRPATAAGRRSPRRRLPQGLRSSRDFRGYGGRPRQRARLPPRVSGWRRGGRWPGRARAPATRQPGRPRRPARVQALCWLRALRGARGGV